MTSRILLADDHPITQVGMANAVEQSGAGIVAGEARSVDELLQFLETESCDIVITDFRIPGPENISGLAMLYEIRTRFPHVPIIVTTSMVNPAIYHAILHMGVKALISKSEPVEEISQAIKMVLAGKTFVSTSVLRLIVQGGLPMGFHRSRWSHLGREECRIVKAWAEGMPLDAIASTLNAPLASVYWRKRSAMRKLGARTDSELFTYVDELAGLPAKWFVAESGWAQPVTYEAFTSAPASAQSDRMFAGRKPSDRITAG